MLGAFKCAAVQHQIAANFPQTPVVMLFTAEAMRDLRANPAWAAGGAIRMGEAMARRAA